MGRSTCATVTALFVAAACLAVHASALQGQQPVPPPPPRGEPDADSSATRVTALVGLQRFHFAEVGTVPELELRVEKRIDPVFLFGGSLAGSWRDHEAGNRWTPRSGPDRWGLLVFLTALGRLEAPGPVSPWLEGGGGFFAHSDFDPLMDGSGIAGHVGAGISADVEAGVRIHVGYRLRKLDVDNGGTTHTFSVGVTLPAGPFGAPDVEAPDRPGG